MATHRIFLDASSSTADERVGNSMSTTFTWHHETRKIWVSWKGKTVFSTVIPRTVDRVQIKCDGAEPTVTLMTPPSNPVAKVAWEFAFYKGMRRDSRAEVEAEFDRKTTGGVERVVRGKGYAFAYAPCMGGGAAYPLCWWADRTANAAEIDVALGHATGRGLQSVQEFMAEWMAA